MIDVVVVDAVVGVVEGSELMVAVVVVVGVVIGGQVVVTVVEEFL